MIRSYRSKGLRRFVEQGDASKLNVPNIRRIERIVTQLDVATVPEEMNSPGLRFHGLHGKDKGRYAVDASGNWRITFGWQGDDAIEVRCQETPTYRAGKALGDPTLWPSSPRAHARYR